MFKISDIKEDVLEMHNQGYLAYEICEKFNISLYTLFEQIIKPGIITNEE